MDIAVQEVMGKPRLVYRFGKGAHVITFKLEIADRKFGDVTGLDSQFIIKRISDTEIIILNINLGKTMHEYDLGIPIDSITEPDVRTSAKAVIRNDP